MLIAVGAVLVLLTWLVAAVVTTGLGLAIAAAVLPTAPGRDVVRAAMWIGLGAGSGLTALFSLVVPLSSPLVPLLVTALAALSTVVAWRSLRQRRGGSLPSAWPWAVVLGVLVLAQVLLAVAALGPVTNYDSGLYHLGAIAYGRDFAAIPGLANLYGPLGYSTLEFVWGSAFSSGPWGAEGFRLVNGLLMLLVVLDLALRLSRRRRRVGDYVLLAGIVVAWIPMVAMADYWVTSPTQDSAALTLTVAASAYLADAVAGRRSWRADAAVALVLCALLTAVRTTMLLYAGAVLAVVVVLVLRRRRARGVVGSRGAVWLVPAGLAVVLAAAMTARDYVLSGWLQYPLSILAFDVPWRAADPTGLREATLGFWRDREDPAGALDGWAWVGGWLARLPMQWEPYYLGLLVLAVVVGLLLAARSGHARWRAMLLTIVPGVVATVGWWATSPPGFRFVWGPLFTCGSVALGWCAWSVTKSRRADSAVPAGLAAAGALPLLLVIAVTAGLRMPWMDRVEEQQWTAGIVIPYAAVPIKEAAVAVQVSSSGLQTLRPIESDRCWAMYPLCSPQAPESLRLRGAAWPEGFLGQL